MSTPRVCVIGAGVAGLTATKALADVGVPATTFECSDRVGGNWAFGNPNGRSAAYRSLHIDTPRKILQFDDLPIPDDWPVFMHHSLVGEYLEAYTDTFALRERIRFKTEVTHVVPQAGGGYRVTVTPVDDPGAAEELDFDAVIVANGHHWDTSWPDPPFPGRFDGDVIHSHSYVDPRTPVDCEGKRTLVVGIGNSGADIAAELSHRAVSSRAFISVRSGVWVLPLVVFGRPLGDFMRPLPLLSAKNQRRLASLVVRALVGRPQDYGLPRPDHRVLEAHPTASQELLWRLRTGDLVAKPNIRRLDGKRVEFVDGSVEEIDVIVYATGFKVTFPFFDPEFVSAPGNVLPLFKRVFKPGVDDLAFIGLCQPNPTLFGLCEAQAKWVAEAFAGRYVLPSPHEMERVIAHDHQVQTAHFVERPRHTMQVDLATYLADLEQERVNGRARAALAGEQLTQVA